MSKGVFITFEGGDGGGKSTLIRSLKEHFEGAGLPVVSTREPGGTPGSEEIRALVLKGHAVRWDAMSETLLMFAARRDLIVNFIKPHLAAGTVILCDRFVDSTVVYQGFGGGVSIEWIQNLYQAICEGIYPDLTLVLDVDPEIGLQRTQGRMTNSDECRFESMPFEYHQRIREGFLSLAHHAPQRYAVINANLPPEVILQQALAQIERRCLTNLGSKEQA